MKNKFFKRGRERLIFKKSLKLKYLTWIFFTPTKPQKFQRQQFVRNRKNLQSLDSTAPAVAVWGQFCRQWKKPLRSSKLLEWPILAAREKERERESAVQIYENNLIIMRVTHSCRERDRKKGEWEWERESTAQIQLMKTATYFSCLTANGDFCWVKQPLTMWSHQLKWLYWYRIKKAR